MSSYVIFNLPETMMATGAMSELNRDARGSGLLAFGVGVATCLLVLIGLVDWELYFRIFEFMTGGEDFWSPHLMACTPAIMLIGFHLLARKSPDHPVVKVVGKLSAIFIIAFVLGGGLYIAAMLYIDAGAPGQQVLPMPVLGELPDASADQSWLDALFNNVTSPAGVLALSLGIGGLSVVSVYVGHWLISFIESGVRQIYSAQTKLREGTKQYRQCQAAESRFAELAAEHERLAAFSDGQLLAQIAGLVLKTINTRAIPHEHRLQEMRFSGPDTLLDHDQGEEIKRVEAALKRIRAISLADVLEAISSADNLRRAS